MLQKGSKAPEFTLFDDTQQAVSLSALLTKGRVVLMFYPADDTPVCTKEACMVRDRFKNVPGVTIVGISPQHAQSKTRFREKHNLTHVLLSDPSSKVAATYQARGMFGLPIPFGTQRVSYTIDRDGTILDCVHSEISLTPHEALLARAAGS